MKSAPSPVFFNFTPSQPQQHGVTFVVSPSKPAPPVHPSQEEDDCNSQPFTPLNGIKTPSPNHKRTKAGELVEEISPSPKVLPHRVTKAKKPTPPPTRTLNNDLPLPDRLRSCLTSWHPAWPGALSKKASLGGGPPRALRGPPSTCKGSLFPHILELLSLGVISRCPKQPCFVSRVFLVPKASEGESW